LCGLVIGTVLLEGPGRPALAQQASPVTRADSAGYLGWLAVHTRDSEPYDNDWHDSLFGAVSAGWYWTDHLKTELDFGAGTEAADFRAVPVVIDGSRTYAFSERTFSRRVLGVSQQYQFFRNAWFHPHVAAGVNVTWERSTERIEPITIYDDVSRGGRVVRPGRSEGAQTDVTVVPFVATGFKAYLGQRGFFRSDLRVAIGDRVEDVLLRLGFGVDF
jgi:hypothetical protein